MTNVWQKNIILIKADKLAHLIYSVTKNFPKQEQYGLTSQIRRSSVSVILNMIEGYSRFRDKSHIQFLEVSFGSLKETHYLVEFCTSEKLITQQDSKKLILLCDEVEKMLYSKIKTLKQKTRN